jgi:uncharacterized repeat protein (TIGR03803 family)
MWEGPLNSIVFRITTNGALTTLASFNPSGGYSPVGRLLQASDGNFYGTSLSSGAYGYGTVFQVTTNGTFTVLVSFDNTNGGLLFAGLVQGADGNLYGTTARGGSRAGGNIFRIVLPPVIQLSAVNNGKLTFTWSATSGRNYHVQYLTDLGQNNWKNVASVTATNSVGTISDDLNADRQRFYRVVLMP